MENDKKLKKQKNNIYGLQDIKDIIMGDASIELKYETIAVSVGMIAAVINLINNIIFFTSRYMLIHSAAVVIAIPLVFVVSAQLFDDVDAFIARRMLAIIGPPFLAIVWFISGGYKSSAGIIWMIYMVVFNSLITSDKKSRYYALYAIIVNVVIVIVIYTNPQLNIPLDRPQMIEVQSFVNIIVICMFFFVTVKLQKMIADMERNKLVAKEEEITAIYEEVLATNADLQSANDKLIELNDTIEQQMETQTRFTSSMNHELRSPLNAIIGTLQILKMNDKLTKEDGTLIASALSSGRLMLQIVNDLLDFAKLREGKFDIVDVDFELEKLVATVWGSFNQQARAKNLEFRIDVKEGTYTRLRADDVRIEQVLNNLLSNAIKYTDSGNVTLSIGNTTRNDKAAIELIVADTGQGMATSDIDEIAKPYSRFNLEKNNKIQGTGLGMNVVRLLVEAMGGTIQCKTELNVGTEFTVVLPVIICNQEEKYTSDDNIIKIDENGNSDYSKCRILCVDDSQINLNVFKGMLRKIGATVITAISGVEAIEIVKSEQFDIIFIDHMMPQMDGIETYKKLKEIAGDSSEYVMLTGNTGDDYRVLYRQEGFKYVMEKPILKKKLLDLIGEIVA